MQNLNTENKLLFYWNQKHLKIFSYIIDKQIYGKSIALSKSVWCAYAQLMFWKQTFGTYAHTHTHILYLLINILILVVGKVSWTFIFSF